MPEVTIRQDDLSGAAIQALVALHLGGMHAHSPACKVHALPLDALRAPGVTFFSAWVGDDLAGMGALKMLAGDHGELKSMRVAPQWLGQGIGKAMLRHLLATAWAMGMARVSLETGRGAAFEPAIALYRAHGFVPCAAFADYVVDDFSQCLTLAL
ncbi:MULTISPECIES: GNAT family N-acetyltransferase [unclassified Novosphingobium]|uniref:GNAT family N-acetyltransferase n=1 Tax=unclassified Novosphingobium TaxID=2644732 RepID=UPI001442444E|nr:MULTISPECIES: GNAT family N-acetyltransferase [unclassified Novosphingobium]MBB3358935.1 putative acetyltransferase [Novosphingobium sp. BK256]MBB3375584.1 putative acetyltransferase [Novosphingobium sp. BK280]MBB3379707.1 putative acetyltransferase [Novosphingobium sp. BK258]MBB3421402.1 putative acetyltransferase [Novosphingobium sp. BK267]MBB3449717.1 putative acetyltransferase [Novosphingobium sp. BK352]